jgi:hypothetical protein
MVAARSDASMRPALPSDAGADERDRWAPLAQSHRSANKLVAVWLAILGRKQHRRPPICARQRPGAPFQRAAAMEGTGKFELGLGMKLTMGVASAAIGGMLIVVPNKKQKDKASLDLFDRPFGQCSHQEQRAAEFQAGYARWKGFFDGTVYKITRQLPGAQTPVLNPYRDVEQAGGEDSD